MRLHELVHKFGGQSLLSLMVFVTSLVFFVGCGRDIVEEPQVSVLFISLDTVRADARTPCIDGLAREGVLFEDAMCQAPATGPSFASIMTSKYPQNCGVLHSTMVLPEAQRTLAEELRGKDYRTGAFVSCSILQSKYGFAQGFDVYDETFTKQYSERDVERDAVDTTQALIQWLGADSDKPFFAWVHYFDTHAPYEKRTASRLDEELGTYAFLRNLEKSRSVDDLEAALPTIRALYNGEMTHIDAHVVQFANDHWEL